MKGAVKNAPKSVSMYREFLREFRYFSHGIKNMNDFMIDHVINAAIDEPNEKAAAALASLHDNPSVLSKINNGGRFTGAIFEYYAPSSEKDKVKNKSAKAIEIIKKNLSFAYSYIPEENSELFSLSIFEIVRSSGKISQDGLNYLYYILSIDRYSFVCNAYYFLVTLVEPLEWALYWRAKNKAVEAKIINLPFLRNNNFIGRESDIDAITGNFKDASVQCITGIIGCGKTQIAIEYAYRATRTYSYIFWINSYSEAAIINDYKKIILSTFRYNVNAINHLSHDSLPRIQDEFCDWFRGHDRWLLIYDGFHGDFDISEYLPKVGTTGHILITSSYKNSVIGAKDYELDLIPIDESMAIIDSHIHEKSADEKQSLRSFIYELGNLPMALGHARDYLYYNPSESYNSYLELMEKKGTLLFDSFGSKSKSESTLRKSISVTYEKICEQYPNAVFFLNMCAFLTDEFPIELGIFESYAKQSKCLLPKDLRAIFRDKLEFSELIRPLKMYSICTDVIFNTVCHWSENKNTTLVRIHKLTLSTIRELCDSEKYLAIVNDMIYRTIAISERSQAETIYNSMEKWKNEKSITIYMRDYSYTFFKNVRHLLPSKVDEQNLLKIIFDLLIVPVELCNKDVRQWLSTTGASLLADCNETTMGWLVCNFLHYLGVFSERKTREEAEKCLRRFIELLKNTLSTINYPVELSERLEDAIEILADAFSNSEADSSIDEYQKDLSTILAWAKNNKNIRHTYSLLDKYALFSEEFELAIIEQTGFYKNIELMDGIISGDEALMCDDFFVEFLEYENKNDNTLSNSISSLLSCLDSLIEMINTRRHTITPLPNHLLELIETAKKKSVFLTDVFKKYASKDDISDVLTLRDTFLTEYAQTYISLIYACKLANELCYIIEDIEYVLGLDNE